ncbi:hypothetical protein N7522_002733 [Penicillium canescens]|nr:hypothetical protein N7522_002733 [Penicillium canescens]
MSSDPLISHLTGPTNATLSHQDEHIEHIEPMSAGWTTDYIMHVKLDSKDGTDIPLYNENLSYFGLGIMRQHGDQSEYFNIEQEDYWLFYAHLHDAEMEIIIGGKPQSWSTLSLGGIISPTKKATIYCQIGTGPDN